MSIDLLILDDDLTKLTLVKQIADRYELTCIMFTSGYQAREYLNDQNKENLPLGYMIDMRIPNEDDNISIGIFNLIKKKVNNEPERMKYFRFFTGHWSSHDEIVEEETQAAVIVKGGDVVKALEEYMSLLKAETNRIKAQFPQQ